MDNTDKRILELLTADSRRPNAELGHAVGLTEGAVRNRIKQLIKSGTIKRFTVEIGNEQNHLYAIVMLKAQGETKRMMAEVSELKVCKEAYEVSGDSDACVVLEGNSIEDIDKKIDQMRKLKSVADTKTFVSFRKW